MTHRGRRKPSFNQITSLSGNTSLLFYPKLQWKPTLCGHKNLIFSDQTWAICYAIEMRMVRSGFRRLFPNTHGGVYHCHCPDSNGGQHQWYSVEGCGNWWFTWYLQNRFKQYWKEEASGWIMKKVMGAWTGVFILMTDMSHLRLGMWTKTAWYNLRKYEYSPTFTFLCFCSFWT